MTGQIQVAGAEISKRKKIREKNQMPTKPPGSKVFRRSKLHYYMYIHIYICHQNNLAHWGWVGRGVSAFMKGLAGPLLFSFLFFLYSTSFHATASLLNQFMIA